MNPAVPPSEQFCGYRRCRPHDQPRRSLVKAITYRLITAVVFWLILWAVDNLMTGGTSSVFGVRLRTIPVGVDLAWRLGVYFLHERLWDRIPYGRTVEIVTETSARTPIRSVSS